MKKLKTKVLALLSAVCVLASAASVSVSAAPWTVSPYYEYQGGYKLNCDIWHSSDNEPPWGHYVEAMTWGICNDGNTVCSRIYTRCAIVDRITGATLPSGDLSANDYNTASGAVNVWCYAPSPYNGIRVYGTANFWTPNGGSYVVYNSATRY